MGQILHEEEGEEDALGHDTESVLQHVIKSDKQRERALRASGREHFGACIHSHFLTPS